MHSSLNALEINRTLLSPQVGQKSSRRAVIHLTTSAPVTSAPGAANTSPSPSLRLRRTAAAWRACCVRPGRACTLPFARRPRETRAIWQCSLDRAVGERGGAARPVRRDEGRALVGGASVGGGLKVGLHGLPHLLLRVELLLRLAWLGVGVGLALELGLRLGSGLGLGHRLAIFEGDLLAPSLGLLRRRRVDRSERRAW